MRRFLIYVCWYERKHCRSSQIFVFLKQVRKLTVKDIVNECQITRQTFYYHFEDIPALFRWILKQDEKQMLHSIFSMDNTEKILKYFFQLAIHITPDVKVPILSYPAEKGQLRPFPAFRRGWARAKPENEPFSLALFFHNLFDTTLSII